MGLKQAFNHYKTFNAFPCLSYSTPNSAWPPGPTQPIQCFFLVLPSTHLSLRPVSSDLSYLWAFAQDSALVWNVCCLLSAQPNAIFLSRPSLHFNSTMSLSWLPPFFELLKYNCSIIYLPYIIHYPLALRTRRKRKEKLITEKSEILILDSSLEVDLGRGWKE